MTRPAMPPVSPPVSLDYAPPGRPRRTRLALFVAILAAIFLLGLMPRILFPPLGRSRETANRVKCLQNLRTLGYALRRYADHNAGRFPDSLEPLIASGHADPLDCICPSSNDTRPPGADAAAQARNLHAGAHLSYIYAGKGLTTASDPEKVLLYEPLDNHAGDGMNVLLLNGTVEFLNKHEARQVLTPPQAAQQPTPGR